MTSSSTAQTRKHNQRKKPGGCLAFLLKLAVLIICLAVYSLAGRYYTTQHVITFDDDTGAQRLDIVAVPGETITLNIQYGSPGSDDLQSSSGIRLLLDGIPQPFQVIAPIPQTPQVYMTCTGLCSRQLDPMPTLGGVITLPSSLPGGAGQTLLQGKLQGTIERTTSVTQVNNPVQIHLVSPLERSWSGGQFLFDGVAGIGILAAIALLVLEARRLRIVYKTSPNAKRYPFRVYVISICFLSVGAIGLAFLAQLAVTHLLIGVPLQGNSPYPGEIDPLTYGLFALFGVDLVVYITRLFSGEA